MIDFIRSFRLIHEALQSSTAYDGRGGAQFAGALEGARRQRPIEGPVSPGFLAAEAAWPTLAVAAQKSGVADSGRQYGPHVVETREHALLERVAAWRSATAETYRGVGGRGADGRPMPAAHAVADLEAEIYALAGEVVAGRADVGGGGRSAAVTATRAVSGSVPAELRPLVLAAGQGVVDGLPAEAGTEPLSLTVDSTQAQALRRLVSPGGETGSAPMRTALAQALLWREQADADRSVAEGLEVHAARMQARHGDASDAYRLARLRADAAYDRAQVSATLKERYGVAVEIAAADPALGHSLAAGWRQVNAALAPLGLSVGQPHPSATLTLHQLRAREEALDQEVGLGLDSLTKAHKAVQLAEAVEAKGDEAEAARLDKVKLGEIVAALDRARTTPRQALLQEALEASANELLEHGSLSPERSEELERLRVEAEAAWLAQHPAPGSDLAKETGQRRALAEADKREALALAQKERLSRELDQQMLAGDGLRIELRVHVSTRAVAATAPRTAERQAAEAELLAAQAQRQQQQAGGREQRIAADLEVAQRSEEVARLALDLEQYKTNVLGANQTRNPHQFDTAFTDGRGDHKKSDRIEVVVKDGQLYQQNSFKGELTGEYQLSWAENAPTKGVVPREFDGLSGTLYRARLRLDEAKRQAAQREERSLQEQRRDADARLATARAQHGPDVQGRRKGDDGERPHWVAADWVQLNDGRWVHPEVAALVVAREKLDEQQAQTERERDFLEFRLSHPNLVGLDGAHDERVQAHYAREREAVRRRYFEVYQQGLVPIPSDPGAQRRNALGKAMGFAVPEEASANASTDLFAGEQLAMIEWVDRRIREAAGDKASVVPSMLLHVSDEVGIKPIVHLEVKGEDGKTALIDTSLAYEAAILQANVPWRFDDLEDWRAGNTLSDKGTVYGRGRDGKQWALAAHETSTMQTVITYGTMAADVASFIPGVNIIARPLAFAGNAYLGVNAVKELAAINRHGQSVWSKEGLMTAGSAAVSGLGIVAPALRAATLYRGGMTAGRSLRASVGATGHHSLLSSDAGHVLADSGELALRLARGLDQGQFLGGTALMAASVGDVAAIEDFNGDALLNLMDFASGLHGTIAGGLDIIALPHAVVSSANRPASGNATHTFLGAPPHANLPESLDLSRTGVPLEPATTAASAPAWRLGEVPAKQRTGNGQTVDDPHQVSAVAAAGDARHEAFHNPTRPVIDIDFSVANATPADGHPKRPTVAPIERGDPTRAIKKESPDEATGHRFLDSAVPLKELHLELGLSQEALGKRFTFSSMPQIEPKVGSPEKIAAFFGLHDVDAWNDRIRRALPGCIGDPIKSFELLQHIMKGPSFKDFYWKSDVLKRVFNSVLNGDLTIVFGKKGKGSYFVPDIKQIALDAKLVLDFTSFLSGPEELMNTLVHEFGHYNPWTGDFHRVDPQSRRIGPGYSFPTNEPNIVFVNHDALSRQHDEMVVKHNAAARKQDEGYAVLLQLWERQKIINRGGRDIWPHVDPELLAVFHAFDIDPESKNIGAVAMQLADIYGQGRPSVSTGSSNYDEWLYEDERSRLAWSNARDRDVIADEHLQYLDWQQLQRKFKAPSSDATKNPSNVAGPDRQATFSHQASTANEGRGRSLLQPVGASVHGQEGPGQLAARSRAVDMNLLSHPSLQHLQVAASAQWLCVAAKDPTVIDVQHVASKLRPDHRHILLAIPGAERVAHQLAARTGLEVQYLDHLGILQIEPGPHPTLSVRNSGPWKKAVPTIAAKDELAALLDVDPAMAGVVWHEEATPGARLKALRLEHGLSQAALAEDLKVPLRKIKEIENGKDSGRTLWARLAEYFGVHPSQLTGVVWHKQATPGARLKAIRIEHGLTQKELSEHLDLDKHDITQIECGNRSGFPHWQKIADFFGVDPSLLTGVVWHKEATPGARLKALRFERGLTRKELGEHLGLEDYVIRQIEHGITSGYPHWQKIAAFFGVDPSLLTGVVWHKEATPRARLKALRLERGLTQKELGEHLELGESVIRQIESGNTSGSLHWEAIAAFFGVDRDQLTGTPAIQDSESGPARGSRDGEKIVPSEIAGKETATTNSPVAVDASVDPGAGLDGHDGQSTVGAPHHREIKVPSQEELLRQAMVSLPDRLGGVRLPLGGVQTRPTPLSDEMLQIARNAARASIPIDWRRAKTDVPRPSVPALPRSRAVDVNFLSNPKLQHLQVAASAQWLCVAAGDPSLIDVQHVASKLRPEHRHILLAIPGAERLAHQLAARTGIEVQYLDRHGTLKIEPGPHPRLSVEKSGPWKTAVTPGHRLQVLRVEHGLTQDELAARLDVDPAMIDQFEDGSHELVPWARIAGIFGVEPSQLTGVVWHEEATPGARLKALRREHGMSQNDLAKRMKVSLAKIQDIEIGDSSRIDWGKLAEFFNVDPSQLTGVVWHEEATPGARLKALRLLHGLTQKELGGHLQLNRYAIKDIESGHTSGNLHWEKIALFFGVDRDQLTGTHATQDSKSEAARGSPGGKKIVPSETIDIAGKEPAKTHTPVAADASVDLAAARDDHDGPSTVGAFHHRKMKVLSKEELLRQAMVSLPDHLDGVRLPVDGAQTRPAQLSDEMLQSVGNAIIAAAPTGGQQHPPALKSLNQLSRQLADIDLRPTKIDVPHLSLPVPWRSREVDMNFLSNPKLQHLQVDASAQWLCVAAKDPTIIDVQHVASKLRPEHRHILLAIPGAEGLAHLLAARTGIHVQFLDHLGSLQIEPGPHPRLSVRNSGPWKEATPTIVVKDEDVTPGDRLQALRVEHGLTQEQLAARLDVDAAMIDQFEDGSCKLVPWATIAGILGVEPSQLTGVVWHKEATPGARLKELRLEHGLSQEALAKDVKKALGKDVKVSLKKIKDIENGRDSGRTLWATLAEFFGAEPSQLTGVIWHEEATPGGRLKALRIERGLTQKDLNGHLDLDQNVIPQIECGNTSGYPHWQKIADFFGVDPSLLTGVVWHKEATPGARLKALRFERGLTQKELGEHLGLEDYVIRQIEYGITSGYPHWQKIAAFFGVDPSLLTGVVWHKEATPRARLKALRLERGLTQKELGEHLELGEAVIRQIESGNTSGSLHWEAIADFFGVDRDQLTGTPAIQDSESGPARGSRDGERIVPSEIAGKETATTNTPVAVDASVDPGAGLDGHDGQSTVGALHHREMKVSSQEELLRQAMVSLPDRPGGVRLPLDGVQTRPTPLSDEMLQSVRNAASAAMPIDWRSAKTDVPHRSVSALPRSRAVDVNFLSNPKLQHLQVAASAQWLCVAAGDPSLIDVQHVASKLRPEHRHILLAIPGAERLAHQLAARTGIEVQYLDHLGILQIEPGPHPRLSVRNSGPWKTAVPISAARNEDVTPGGRLHELRVEHDLTQDQLAERLGVDTAMVRKFEDGSRKLVPWATIAGIFGEDPSHLTGVVWHEEATPGARLKALRLEHGLSQEALATDVKKILAKDVKVSLKKIQDIENGRASGRTLWAGLAEFFGVDPSRLTGVVWHEEATPGGRLKALRIERGLTQKELNGHLDLDQDITKWIECGNRSGFPHWKKIAAFFGVDPSLLTGIVWYKEATPGARLKALRFERGLTQKELSGHLKLEDYVIRQIEHGITSGYPHWKKIAAFFEVDTSLLTGVVWNKEATPADRLKALRLEHGLTQKELSGHLELDESVIQQIETGNTSGYPHWKKIAAFFGVDTSLLTGVVWHKEATPADRLKALRLEHDLSQKALGELLQIGPRVIQHIESGETSGSLHWEKIAAFFRVSLRQLTARPTP